MDGVRHGGGYGTWLLENGEGRMLSPVGESRFVAMRCVILSRWQGTVAAPEMDWSRSSQCVWICLWYLILMWQTFMIPHQRWSGSVSLHQCNAEGICGRFHTWGCITVSAYLYPTLFPERGGPFRTSGTHKKDGGWFQGGCFHIASNMGYSYIWSGEGANAGWIA